MDQKDNQEVWNEPLCFENDKRQSHKKYKLLAEGLREMGMTGGVCSRHDMIYVNPYGEIKKCYYDKEDLHILESPDDLEYVYRKLHPQEPLKTCHLVTNGDRLKALRDAKKNEKKS